MLSYVPSNQRAVLHHALLNENTLGSVRLDHTAVLEPQHLHVLCHKGSLTLERQTITLENHLPLGWSELEGGQLKRSIYGD